MADRIEINSRLAECSHGKVEITRADVEKIIQKFHDEYNGMFINELRLTGDYIPELSEIVLRRFENQLEIESIVENFLLDGDVVSDVQNLHKELGIYERKDWIEEMDKYCPECGEIYPNEDPDTAEANFCAKCGVKLEINNGL